MADRPLCRLTVLSPQRRVDVALPSDVPVAELVPMVLELVGEPDRARGWQPHPWRFCGAAGGPLSAAATLDELGVFDGELLRIGPLSPPPPPPVFDDPVDAVAAGVGSTRTADPRVGAGAVLVVAAVAAGLLAAGGPDSPAAALLAGGAAAAAIAIAAGIVRRADPTGVAAAHSVARMIALAGVVLAAAAGLAALPRPAGTGSLLLAAAAAGVAAAAAQMALRVVAPALVATGVVAIAAVAALTAVRLGAAPASAAAATGAIAILVGPLLPRAAIRLAGLPRPVVPTDAAELVDADDEANCPPPDELADRADLARGLLAGLVGGTAVVAAGSADVAATPTGWAGTVFAGVVVVVLALRARGYGDPAPCRTTLAAAIGAGLLLAITAASALRVPAAGALLMAAGVGVAVLNGWRPPGSPVARRAVDIGENLLVAASVPLALAAMDLFSLVRGW